MPVDLQPTTDLLAAIVADLRDDELDLPTPCERYRVGDLLDHVGGLSMAFTAAATKDFTGLPPDMGAPTPDAANLNDDWPTQIPAALSALAAAWKPAEAWDGMTKAGGLDLPGEIAGLVALDEVTVHAWDLAVATGRPFRGDPEALEAVHAFVASFEPPDGEGPADGLFGPPIDVPSTAPTLDRLLGLTGRNPTWSPT